MSAKKPLLYSGAIPIIGISCYLADAGCSTIIDSRGRIRQIASDNAEQSRKDAEERLTKKGVNLKKLDSCIQPGSECEKMQQRAVFNYEMTQLEGKPGELFCGDDYKSTNSTCSRIVNPEETAELIRAVAIFPADEECYQSQKECYDGIK